MALQPLARLFSMPLIAYLTDHISKKRLVLIGSLGRTLAYILYWSSLVIQNLFLFGVGTFCQGLLVGFFWPPFFSLLSEKSYKGNRTQALAEGRGKMIGYGFLIGAFISIPIFSIVSIFLPENIALMYSPLLLFAAINVFAGIRFYLRVDETLTYEKFIATLKNSNLLEDDVINDRETIESIDHKNSRPPKSFYFGFITLILVILGTSMNGMIYSPFISAFLIENLLPSFSVRIIPIIVMVVYFPAQVISQLMASKFGKLFDRISPLKSVIFNGIFKSLMIWLLICAFSAIDFAIFLIFLYIVTESNSYLIQAIMSRVSIKHRGKVFGLTMWVDQLGRVIGPIIGGILWDKLDYNVPFLISIYIGLCLIPFFIFAIRKLSPYMVEKVEIDTIGIVKINKSDNSS